MNWTMIHRKRDGSVETTRHETRRTKLNFVHPSNRAKDKSRQLSISCGVPLPQLAKAKIIDRKLGVSDEYEVRGAFAYKVFSAAPTVRQTKNRWLRAHRWVDHDAGYGDPAPGDFTG